MCDLCGGSWAQLCPPQPLIAPQLHTWGSFGAGMTLMKIISHPFCVWVRAAVFRWWGSEGGLKTGFVFLLKTFWNCDPALSWPSDMQVTAALTVQTNPVKWTSRALISFDSFIRPNLVAVLWVCLLVHPRTRNSHPAQMNISLALLKKCKSMCFQMIVLSVGVQTQWAAHCDTTEVEN